MIVLKDNIPDFLKEAFEEVKASYPDIEIGWKYMPLSVDYFNSIMGVIIDWMYKEAKGKLRYQINTIASLEDISIQGYEIKAIAVLKSGYGLKKRKWHYGFDKTFKYRPIIE